MTREPVQPTPRGQMQDYLLARVEPTPRTKMSASRRLRIYLACNGRCECGAKVPMAGTVIDHRIPLWMGGADDDANLRFLCGPCDKPKTAKDAADRASVKRIHKRLSGDRKPSRLQSRGFQKGVKRPIPSRPFQPREARS